MDWKHVQGRWSELISSARLEWSKLSDRELDLVRGERSKLVGLVQDKYDLSRQEADERVAEWSRKAR